MDYPIHKDYNITRAPETKWQREVCEASRGKLETVLLESFEEVNEFTKSDLQTQHSIRMMLEHVYNYKKLTKNDLIEPLEALERAGKIKMVKKAFANLEKLEVDQYSHGYEFRLLKHRWNPKLYAIRNIDKYEQADTKELRANYYPFAKKENK